MYCGVFSMIKAFEYTGKRDANTWTFQCPVELSSGGESISLSWETGASLSEEGVGRMLQVFRGGGLNIENLWLSTAVGDILNSLAPGLVRALEIPDAAVDMYLNGICEA
jgi:hypothetical protein